MKKLKKFFILVIGLGIVYALILFALIYTGTKDVPSSSPETILVLGAQVRGKDKETAYPSTVLKERLNTAVPYIKEHPEATVIVCGGKGSDEPDSEANVMANYLIAQGIDQAKIIREDTSTSTKENIQQALKKKSFGKAVIVTSDFHISRAKLMAKRLGIKEVSGLPAASTSSVTPNLYAREILALGFYLIFS